MKMNRGLTATEVDCIIKSLKKPTPKTCRFYCRFGQHGWWDLIDMDENMCSQQYHVAAHFGCWAANKKAPSNCGGGKDDCFHCHKQARETPMPWSAEQCKEIYRYIDNDNAKEYETVDAEDIYTKMRRPEMYFWLIEALGFDVESCINQYLSDRSLSNIRKMFPWNDIEAELSCYKN